MVKCAPASRKLVVWGVDVSESSKNMRQVLPPM